MAKPCHWEVMGGGSSGGIVVRSEKAVTSAEEANRLATGSLVRESELDGERLHYVLVSGVGPESGWVSTKFRDKDLLVKTDKEPPPQNWEVVGGASSGGIVVRSGKETSSSAESARLATGALLRQLSLEGERLRYELLEGSGPGTGWVSLKLKDKELVVKTTKRPAESGAPAFLRLLRNHEDASVEAAMRMLPSLGEGRAEAIEGLKGCLKESDVKIVRKALRALAFLGHASSLADCLSSAADTNVRAEAALLLGEVADDGVGAAEVQALAAALASESSSLVRSWAAHSLGLLPPALSSTASSALTEAARIDSVDEVRGAADAAARRINGECPMGRESLGRGGQSAELGPVVGRKLRVLAIHGAAANSKIMKMQVGPFKGALGAKDVEWFFVDSPLIWQPIPGSKDPLFSERSDGEKMLAGEEPFRWWYSHGNAVYSLLDEGVANFRRLLTEHDPIDVVVAFSQGSNLISLVVDSYRKEGQPVPWRVSVYFSGGQIDDRLFRFPKGWTSSQPLVRSYGSVSDDYFHGGEPELSDMFSDRAEFGHADGHGFPRTQPRAKEIYTAMAAEVRKRCGLAAAT